MLRIAAGDANTLSGRHLSVHDDLDALLARVAEIRERDLYVMRTERLTATVETSNRPSSVPPRLPLLVMHTHRFTKPAAAPAYLRGRPVAQWQDALDGRRRILARP